MKKVYCENCKYVNSGVTMRILDKKLIRCNGGPNKKYNCKYYKRKWWKFWVKEMEEK